MANDISYVKVSQNGKGFEPFSLTISNDLGEPILISGDAIIGMEYSIENDWNSIKSPYLVFSINRTWSSLPTKWEYLGSTFAYSGMVEIRVLGNSMKLHKVHSLADNRVVFYSFEKGVVAFSDQDRQEFNYILEEDIGLFAIK
jgi:hypothetical protein